MWFLFQVLIVFAVIASNVGWHRTCQPVHPGGGAGTTVGMGADMAGEGDRRVSGSQGSLERIKKERPLMMMQCGLKS
jgi:hypothetical protein